MRATEALRGYVLVAASSVRSAKGRAIDVVAMNRFGSSPAWSHPPAPTGARLIMERMEKLSPAGGNHR
jgi:hypothetical protein